MRKILDGVGFVLGVLALVALAIAGIAFIFILISALALAVASPIILIVWLIIQVV